MDTEAARAAFVQAAVARALIRAFGMVAENLEHYRRKEPLPYGLVTFEALVAEEGIGHNQVLNSLRP
jgi:hypothetical protein